MRMFTLLQAKSDEIGLLHVDLELPSFAKGTIAAVHHFYNDCVGCTFVFGSSPYLPGQ